MKEIEEAGFRDEIFLPKKHSPREFILMYVSADRYDILMQKFSDLAGCVKVEVKAHFSPMSFLIL